MRFYVQTAASNLTRDNFRNRNCIRAKCADLDRVLVLLCFQVSGCRLGQANSIQIYSISLSGLAKSKPLLFVVYLCQAANIPANKRKR